MKSLQQTISILLVMCLMISLMPVRISAQETAQVQDPTEITCSTSEEPAGDELYEAYLQQVFYGGISLFGTVAGQRLSGDEKVVYDAMVPFLRQIADGQRASAEITVGQPTDGSPVDCEAVFAGREFTVEMLDRVLDALLSDLPYACYWYDKTAGCRVSYSYGETIIQMTLRFTVAQNYRGADQYTTDTAKTGAAKCAADNARNIVSKYASGSDYEKLVGYKNEICTLVSYDSAAADSNGFSVNDDPWQLISVFDGDNTTNVVCEGYSKAFMYLCDLTGFSGDVTCHTVSGYMNGGDHMWNIVDMGGKHYLADVTNSDAGTSGSDGSLFLAGGSGSAAEGYRIGSSRYTYREDMTALWGTGEDSLLTLEAEGYDPAKGNDEEEIIGGACGENLTWSFDKTSKALTISGTGDMYDFDFYGENENPWRSFAIEEVIIESGVTNIGQYAFTRNPECNTASISIPNTVTRFEDFAFYYSGSLTEIHIPDSVEYIGTGVFSECQLARITVDSDNTHFCNDASGALLTIDGSELIRLPPQFNGSYAVADSVETIQKDAFMGCSDMTEITIPETVTDIGDSAFYCCIGLKEVILPAGMSKTNDFLFSLCENITKITLPDNLTTIGTGTFHGCTNLKELEIPPSVTNIGDRAFGYCNNLEHIIFSGNAPEFCETAFDNVETCVIYPADNPTWTSDVLQNYGGSITWKPYCAGKHTYTDSKDTTCNVCGAKREVAVRSVPMFRMYDPNSSEHFYTGSEEEREILVAAGWHYEGVGFNFPVAGSPVHRLYEPITGEHLYTMKESEKNSLLASGWNYEGVAFNSAGTDEVPQYRLHNPNAKRGAYHFTGSEEERDMLIALGWEYQGIGWYSCLR